jgi:hypothetical protein
VKNVAGLRGEVPTKEEVASELWEREALAKLFDVYLWRLRKNDNVDRLGCEFGSLLYI